MAIKATQTVFNMKAYGADGDGSATVGTENANDRAAWDAIKLDLPAEGGTIFFPNGEYNLELDILRDNVRIVGESREGTIINSTVSSANCVQVSVYRRGGWDTTLANLTPYTDTMKVGQSWIEPKDSGDLANFSVGDKIFIAAGSSVQFDQENGEFNVVDYITSTRLYLKYPLLNDYGTDVAPWSATVNANFTPPALNSPIDIQVETEAVEEPDSIPYISIGNDLYEFDSLVSGTSPGIVTWRVINRHSTNGSGQIDAGTKIFKQRVIIKTPQTYGNVVVENITLRSESGDVVNLSNSIDVEIRNCNIYRGTGGGFWMDGDDGRDARFRNCKIECEILKTAQPARSFAEMSFRDCEFVQATMHFSEFCKNCEVINNKFHAYQLNDADSGDGNYPFTDSAPIGIGWTTSNMRVEGNWVYGDGITCLIDTFPDINGWRNAWRGGITIKDNWLFANDTTFIIRAEQLGDTEIAGNKMFGSTDSIFAIKGHELVNHQTANTANGDLYIHSSYLDCHHNSFTGVLANVNFGEMFNIKMTDNYFHAIGDINNSNDDKGNIIYDFGGTQDIQMVVVKDNTFVNWLYRDLGQTNPNQSFNFQGTQNDRVDITNNRFIDARNGGGGPFASEFVVDVYPLPPAAPSSVGKIIAVLFVQFNSGSDTAYTIEYTDGTTLDITVSPSEILINVDGETDKLRGWFQRQSAYAVPNSDILIEHDIGGFDIYAVENSYSTTVQGTLYIMRIAE